MGWREKAAPIVRWGSIVIGVLFAISGLWSLITSFTRFNIVNFVLYIYAIIFGLLLAVAEMEVWPPLAEYFGFLSNGSGRAWFLFFISTLCLANGIGGTHTVSTIFLMIVGCIGIILSIIGIIIRKDSAVVNREAVNLPGVFKGGSGGGSNRAAAGDNAI